MSEGGRSRVGKFLGVPYDWRRPTRKRFKSRWWNPDDPRFLTPRWFGWGYDFNVYWLFHRKEKQP